MIQTLNPATGEVVRRFDPLPDAALEKKIELAAEAARVLPRESLEQRRLWMRRLALLLETDQEELARTATLEVGKTLTSSRMEVAKCATACRFYADNAARFLEPETVETEHGKSYVRWDPLGVLLAIMPWNFPFWQVFRFLAPALMAGNVALLKHAPSVPQCALALETLVRRAGFPRGSLQALLIEAQQVEGVLADNRVRGVTLTGSESAGRAIGAQAGYLLKPHVLELGGSDPFLVLPSADLQTAAAQAVQARCINNGQSCIAAKRFVVHTDVYDEFSRLFVAGMAAMRVGDPMLESTQVGPLSSEAALTRLESQVQRAVASGGKLLSGGRRLPGPGFFFAPAVIEDLPREAEVYSEEFFGPVALLYRVASLSEAIAVANDTPFGLGASCWTREAEEQNRLAREIESGSVFFNLPVASDPRLPFGGIKQSGYGRELSAIGMQEFMNRKTVVVAASEGQLHQTDLVFTEALQPRKAAPKASSVDELKSYLAMPFAHQHKRSL